MQQLRRAQYLARGTELALTARLGPRRRTKTTCPTYRKLFVVGCPRSGTTWVQKIFQAHPHVVGTDESYAFFRITQSVERGRYDPRGWGRLLYQFDRDQRRGKHVGLHRYVDRPHLRRLAIDAIRSGSSDQAVADRLIDGIFDDFYRRVSNDQTELFVEKTPSHLWYADRILEHYPEARIVEVLRDGRDVCASMQVLARFEEWLPPTLEAQIREWVAFAEEGLGLRAKSQFSSRVLLVRFEDLKTEPVEGISRLFDFAGLTSDDALVRGVARATDFSRLENTGDRSHARRGEVGDWVNHLTPEDEQLFREIAGPTFLEVGYTF
jgi:hypothetical protein